MKIGTSVATVVALLVGAYVFVHIPNHSDRRLTDVPQMTAALKSMTLCGQWNRLKVNEITGYSCDLTLVYRDDVGSIQAEADTKALARFVLAELVREGVRPAKDYSSVTIDAMQGGLFGETGESMVRPYGMTSYNFARDRLDWIPM
jgi:hypothetical protein